MFSERERNFFLPTRQQRPSSHRHMSPERRMGPPRIFGPLSVPAHSPKKPQSSIDSIKNMFQTEDGNWDIAKIMSTAEQINGVYKEVRPLFSGFLKK